jgi:hypothetical protein
MGRRSGLEGGIFATEIKSGIGLEERGVWMGGCGEEESFADSGLQGGII